MREYLSTPDSTKGPIAQRSVLGLTENVPSATNDIPDDILIGSEVLIRSSVTDFRLLVMGNFTRDGVKYLTGLTGHTQDTKLSNPHG